MFGVLNQYNLGKDGKPIIKSLHLIAIIYVTQIETCKLFIKNRILNFHYKNKLEKGTIDNAGMYLIRTVHMVMKEELLLDKDNDILVIQRVNNTDVSYRNFIYTTITENHNTIARPYSC
jgi:hypothetical protein